MTDITTVADETAVVHDGLDIRRYDGLAADSTHSLDGLSVHTLARPRGELLCSFATVNDVHFGEDEAGRLHEGSPGPFRRSAPGAPPYPEVMNRAAVDEITAIDPAAVIVKGDLSVDGHEHEWAAFEACYRTTFGERLHVVRGNHDAYRGQDRYAGHQRIDLPGVTVALLDTVIAGETTGQFTPEMAAWLDDVATTSDVPVVAMGHHQQWIGTRSGRRSDDYFGLHPDGSDLLDTVAARCSNIVAYSAGHTHRHRVRAMLQSGIPSIEVGCVKDFPGTWAEHRVYEDGVMHLVHRMSSPEALAWSESCRDLYAADGVDYETYALGSLGDRCFNIALR